MKGLSNDLVLIKGSKASAESGAVCYCYAVGSGYTMRSGCLVVKPWAGVTP